MGGGISNIRKLVLGEYPVPLDPFDVIEAQDVVSSSLMYETPLIFESDAPKKVYISQLSLNIVITPRREVALRSSVPFTPCGNEAHRYCYYCPLCMEFFESILKTKCCGNYICLKCTLEYLNAKGLLAESVKELVGNNQLKSVCCPHCFTIGFDPQFVESEESIRDYSKDSPVSQKPSDNFITPVKVGDTFEDLKRKMIPFGVTKAITSLNSEGIAATLSRQLSLQDVNKIKKENILTAIFDAAAEQPEDNLNANPSRGASDNNCSGSSDTHSYCNLLDYQIEEIIPQSMIIEYSTRSDIDRGDNVIDDLSGSDNDEKNRKKPANIGVQISLKIVTDGSSKGKEVLNSFLEENSSMKTCCRFIASEMMVKIIDTFLLENDC